MGSLQEPTLLAPPAPIEAKEITQQINGRLEMHVTMRLPTLMSTIALMSLGLSASAQAQPAPPQSPNMTFFITSNGLGKGADLGGLQGADRHCQALAQAAGAGGKTWHA